MGFQTALRRPRVFGYAAVLCVLWIMVPLLASAQSDISRKIIYINGYKPIPGDIYALVIDYGQTSATSGNAAAEYDVTLQEDRTLELPFIGSVNTANLTFIELRTEIVSRIKKAVPVQFVSFSLKAPAVFDVFVYGSVTKPGQIQMTSLNRLTDVVAASGADTANSSHRLIQLRRDGKTQVVDLTKYYIDGKEDANPYLLPGDVVYVPQIAQSVTVSGAVVHPGPYEILPTDSLADIIRMAGGLGPTALVDQASVQRVDENNRYREIPLAKVDFSTFGLKDADRITVPSSLSTTERIVAEGALYGQPGNANTPQQIPTESVRFNLNYRPGITVLDVLDALGGPTPFAETDKSYILRESTGERLPLPDLGDLWKSRDLAKNVVLSAGDHLVVPIMQLTVAVGGEVNSPQPALPYVRGYTVGDYLRAAGGLDPKTSDPKGIYFTELSGKKTRVGLDTLVPPGTNIFVAKNAFTGMQQFFGNVFIVTGWVTSIIGVTITVVDFINRFK